MRLTKFPQGPTSTGAQGARALAQNTRGYAHRVGADFKAWSDGVSQWAAGGDVGFVSYGIRKQNGVEEEVFVGTQDWRMPFAWPGAAVGINCDFGQQLYDRESYSLTGPSPYSYPVNGSGSKEAVSFYGYSGEVDYRIGQNKKGTYARISNAFACTVYPYALMNDGAPLFYLVGPLAYTGRVLRDGESVPRVMTAMMVDGGRTDVAGRKLADVVPVFLHPDGAQEEVGGMGWFTGAAAGKAEYAVPPVILASRKVIFLLVAEHWGDCWAAADETKDMRPPVWLCWSTDGGESWQRSNIREVFSKDFPEPRQHVMQKGRNVNWGLADNTLPEYGFFDEAVIPLVGGKALIEDTATYSHATEEGVEVFPIRTAASDMWVRAHRELVDSIKSTVQAVMVDDSTFVMSYLYLKDASTSVYWVPEQRMRVVRCSVDAAGGGVQVVEAYDRKSDSGKSEYFEHMVHLGNGCLLAKRVQGFTGTDIPVDFMYSSDRGSSWAVMASAGLPAAMVNPYYGHMLVDPNRTEKADQRARVLLPCWDAARGAYCLYQSTDHGASWSFASVMARSDAFYRMDSNVTESGGGNFQTVSLYGQLLRRMEVDPTIPGRYTRSPQA